MVGATCPGRGVISVGRLYRGPTVKSISPAFRAVSSARRLQVTASNPWQWQGNQRCLSALTLLKLLPAGTTLN